jgi:hypothetical protein
MPELKRTVASINHAAKYVRRHAFENYMVHFGPDHYNAAIAYADRVEEAFLEVTKEDYAKAGVILEFVPRRRRSIEVISSELTGQVGTTFLGVNEGKDQD